MSNDLKWVCVSDIHFPRHDPRKVELFMKVLKRFKPHAIDLVGDIDDADSTSRWAEGTPASTISIYDGGVKGTRDFLKELRAGGKDRDIHFHDGNHGWTRHASYLEKKAPAFLDIVTPDTLYQYKDEGVHWHRYDEPPVKRFGKMYVHHGESISKHAAESVRNDCLNFGVSLIRGHSHRQGVYNKTYDLTGQEIEGYEIGHLTKESEMDYTTNHDWQAGFLVAHVENGERPFCQLIRIHDYTCYVDGIKFQA